MNFSLYQGVRDRTGQTILFESLIHTIKSGNNGLDTRTLRLSKLRIEDPERYSQEKLSLPAVTWSGTFRRRKHLIQHSGLVVLDIDNTDVKRLIREMHNEPSLLFGFISPSGKGMKLVIPIDPVPRYAREHKAAFQAVCTYFSDRRFAIDTNTSGELEIDTSGSDVNRLCFLAYDPQAIYNPNATPIPWRFSDPSPPPQKTSNPKHPSFKNSQYNSEVDLEVLDYIPRDAPYETWLMVGMAIKDAGLTLSVWEQWCASQRTRSTGTVVMENMQYKWDSFRRTGITWASVVFLAKQNGYTPRYTQPTALRTSQGVPKLKHTLSHRMRHSGSTK